MFKCSALQPRIERCKAEATKLKNLLLSIGSIYRDSAKPVKNPVIDRMKTAMGQLRAEVPRSQVGQCVGASRLVLHAGHRIGVWACGPAVLVTCIDNVLCWVYIKNGYSYWSSVCVHSAYNLILFLTDNFVFPS